MNNLEKYNITYVTSSFHECDGRLTGWQNAMKKADHNRNRNNENVWKRSPEMTTEKLTGGVLYVRLVDEIYLFIYLMFKDSVV